LPSARAAARWGLASSPASSNEAVAKKKGDRIIIHLACTGCRRRNYTTTKNRRNDPDRLELRKYCPQCRRHLPHREVR